MLACGFVREELSSRGIAPDAGEPPLLTPFGTLPDGCCAEALHRQAELFGLSLIGPQAVYGGSEPEDAGEGEAVGLLRATFLAARLGCRRVLWPASGAVGGGLDLDRIAAISDSALLVGRLVGLRSAWHGVPGIRVETPFVDLTDRQMADLIEDMALPLEACWWWRSDRAGEGERRRWTALRTGV